MPGPESSPVSALTVRLRIKRLPPLVFLLVAGCVSTPELAPEVRKETHGVHAGTSRIAVDFYFQSGKARRPLAVVVHGFLADKTRMSHWGALLAREGFIVAVPNNPTLANDDRNIGAIAGLVKLGRTGCWPVAAKGDGRVLLVGFSRGGYETLRVAAKPESAVDAWVGLDPVDRGSRGIAAAAEVSVPGLVMLAEPELLNANRNAAAMLSAYAGPLCVVEVEGAAHLDAESPRGRGRFSRFEQPVVEFLRRVFRLPPSARRRTRASRVSGPQKSPRWRRASRLP